MALSNLSAAAQTALSLPVLFLQGRRLGRTVPRLPEVPERSGEVGTGDVVRRVVAVGDSVAAGQGVDRGEHTVAGRLARLVAGERGAARWVIHARGGLDADGVRRMLTGAAPEDLAAADVVVVSVGVNDLKAVHSARRWRRELTALLEHLVRAAPRARVVMLGLPPLELFPALPRPMRDVLAVRGRMLDGVARRVALAAGVGYAAVDPHALDATDAFAADGFHPSAATHAAMAEAVARLLTDERRRQTDVVR